MEEVTIRMEKTGLSAHFRRCLLTYKFLNIASVGTSLAPDYQTVTTRLVQTFWVSHTPPLQETLGIRNLQPRHASRSDPLD